MESLRTPLLGFHCKYAVENEIHFLLECPFYDDLRRKLFQRAILCNPDFDALNFTNKFIFLMNNINIQADTAYCCIHFI